MFDPFFRLDDKCRGLSFEDLSQFMLMFKFAGIVILGEKDGKVVEIEDFPEIVRRLENRGFLIKPMTQIK